MDNGKPASKQSGWSTDPSKAMVLAKRDEGNEGQCCMLFGGCWLSPRIEGQRGGVREGGGERGDQNRRRSVLASQCLHFSKAIHNTVWGLVIKTKCNTHDFTAEYPPGYLLSTPSVQVLQYVQVDTLVCLPSPKYASFPTYKPSLGCETSPGLDPTREREVSAAHH